MQWNLQDTKDYCHPEFWLVTLQIYDRYRLFINDTKKNIFPESTEYKTLGSKH